MYDGANVQKVKAAGVNLFEVDRLRHGRRGLYLAVRSPKIVITEPVKELRR